MAGETPKGVIIGLLEKLLESAHAGNIDLIYIVAVGSNPLMDPESGPFKQPHNYAAGYEEERLNRVALEAGLTGHWRDHMWTRIPQKGSLP